MGTPAVINLIDSDTNERYSLYHHYDGYPDGVGRDLAVLVGNLNAGWWMIRPAPVTEEMKLFGWKDKGPDTSMIRLRDWMVNNGVPSGSGLDKGYEVADGINWGADYRYDVVRSGSHWELYCFGYNDTGYVTDCIDIPEYTSGSEETKYWVSMRMTQKELDSIGAHGWGGEKPDLAYGDRSHLWKENGESIYAIRLNDRKGMGAGWLSRFNKGSTKKRFTPILKRRN